MAEYGQMTCTGGCSGSGWKMVPRMMEVQGSDGTRHTKEVLEQQMCRTCGGKGWIPGGSRS